MSEQIFFVSTFSLMQYLCSMTKVPSSFGLNTLLLNNAFCMRVLLDIKNYD